MSKTKPKKQNKNKYKKKKAVVGEYLSQKKMSYVIPTMNCSPKNG